MDRRGRLLVDMVLRNNTRNDVSNHENCVINTKTPEMNNNSYTTSPVSSPCREIPESNPVVMEQLMHELLEEPKENSINQPEDSYLTREFDISKFNDLGNKLELAKFSNNRLCRSTFRRCTKSYFIISIFIS